MRVDETFSIDAVGRSFGGWTAQRPIECREKPADEPFFVYPFTIIMEGANIGPGSKIESFCLVETGAWIGERVTLKSGVYVWNGVTLEDDVFVGPGVKFTNDRWPRVGKPCPCTPTKVGHGASIGAGALLLPGARVPPHSMVAAGAVVLPRSCVWEDKRGKLFSRDGGVFEEATIDNEQAACEKCAAR